MEAAWAGYASIRPAEGSSAKAALAACLQECLLWALKQARKLSHPLMFPYLRPSDSNPLTLEVTSISPSKVLEWKYFGQTSALAGDGNPRDFAAKLLRAALGTASVGAALHGEDAAGAARLLAETAKALRGPGAAPTVMPMRI